MYYKLVTSEYDEDAGVPEGMTKLLDENEITEELNDAANTGRRKGANTPTKAKAKQWRGILESAATKIIRIQNNMKRKNRKDREIVGAVAGWIRGCSDEAKDLRRLGRYMIGEGLTKKDAWTTAEMCLRPPAALRDKIAECSSPYRYMMVNIENDLNEQRVIMTILISFGRCVYCGANVKPYVLVTQRNGVRADDLRATADHVYPVHPEPGTNDSAGGTVFGNMAISCLACNQDKANHSPNKWLAMTPLLTTGDRTNARRQLDTLRLVAGWEPVSQARVNAIDEEVALVRRLVELNPGVDSDVLVKALVAGHRSPITRKLLG